ncbi:MAG: hypothetical protein ACI86M_002171 [Saprospiraceae bacterium]|jgi:hypothetical protein
MKNCITLLLFLLIGISCSKEITQEDKLIGEWIYERVFFSTSSSFSKNDTKGTMEFNENEKGVWVSESELVPKVNFEWDFQSSGSKLAITRLSTFESLLYDKTRIYSVSDRSENTFTLNFQYSIPNIDTLLAMELFENIIFTRT